MSVARPEILLVEDNPDDVATATRAFQRADLADHVVVANECIHALAYLNNSQAPLPRVILLDLKMPAMDGRSLLQHLRASERTRHIPVVIVSTSSHPDDIAACYRMGANSFVVKQFNGPHPGKYIVDVARYWLTLNRSL